MLVLLLYLNIFLYNFIFIQCPYPPIGDEVQVGSVLLPATRRGRYLANIVRRQAVDGTGIKFNKDADRMNAEAKKKVDVLSEELLPYIIAEQERRTTLYKRVMTAIQNGEKGVTIAEIRNKPPLIIRKGLMYRCPANRTPKEPDGSGVILCEDDQDPTPIMYDSCLSAEDKELYVAENKYFFCNRHKIEGPDLPRNGSTVIGCAPLERTSLNYTSGKCALEDTDDVVVHYRYYPDRTYKFVTELDPDREVCDHWNPCQIGYIYSLPSPDQAVPANELWRDYEERPEEYEREEIVPPVPEDNNKEFIANGTNYTTSYRTIQLPMDCKFLGIGKILPSGERMRLTQRDKNVLSNMTHFKATVKEDYKDDHNTVKFAITFKPFLESDVGPYYVACDHWGTTNFIDKVSELHLSTAQIRMVILEELPGQKVNKTRIPLHCNKCTPKSVMLRGDDGTLSNVDNTKYRIKSHGEGQKYIEFDFDELYPEDFGDIFVSLQFEDGTEERNKILSIKCPESSTTEVKADGLSDSLEPGSHYDKTITYDCGDCEVEDILCDGQSVLSGGRITVTPQSKTINFNYPSFQDEYACVYIAVFKMGDGTKVKKTLAVVENASPDVKLPQVEKDHPPDGSKYVKDIELLCAGDCTTEKVTVNGISLRMDTPGTRRSNDESHGYFTITDNILTIIIPIYSYLYSGVFQAVVMTPNGQITKTILYLGDLDMDGGDTASTSGDEFSDKAALDVTEAADDNIVIVANVTTPANDTPADESLTTDTPADDANNVTTTITTPAEDDPETTENPNAELNTTTTTEAPPARRRKGSKSKPK